MLLIDSLQVLPIVAPLVRDDEGCAVLWTFPILIRKDTVEILQKAIYSVIKKKGVEAILLFYNSMNDYLPVFLLIIVNSIETLCRIIKS